MTRWWVLGVVGFGLFLDYFFYGAVIPLTPLAPAHISGHQLGVLYGGFAVSALLLTPVFGYFGDRAGERSIIICGTILTTCAAALFGLGSSFPVLLAARVCMGAGSAAVWTAGLALVAEHYRNNRVEMIGYAFTGSTAGTVLGPWLGGLMHRAGGYRLPFIAIGICLVVALLLQAVFLPAQRKSRDRQVELGHLLRNRSLLLAALAVAMAAFAWGIIEPLLPARLDAFGIPASQVGLMFTISSIFYGASAPVVARVSERLRAKKTIVIGTIAMALALPTVALSERVLFVGLAVCAVNVTYAFVLNPASAELGNAVDRAGLNDYSAAYAVYNIAYSLGMVATTAMASIATGLFGFWGTLLCISGVLILCAVAFISEPAAKAEVAEPTV
jgi:MFS family permease